MVKRGSKASLGKKAAAKGANKKPAAAAKAAKGTKSSKTK